MTSIVHTGDCLAVMPTLPTASVDLCLTDPTYNETSCGWDKQVVGWLPQVRRLLKPSGSVWFFTSLRHFASIAPELKGWTIAQDIVWEKHNGSNSAVGRFRRVHELAVQIYPSDKKWGGVFRAPQFTNDARAKQVRRKARPAHWGEIGEHRYTSIDGGQRQMRSVLRVRSCHGYAIVETQKPVDLVRPLLLYGCPEGGTVLDPFAGSGTTGVVCVQTGRHFIGIEKDPATATKARHRIAESDPIGRQETIGGVA